MTQGGLCPPCGTPRTDLPVAHGFYLYKSRQTSCYQGLPACCSVRTGHWPVLRALATPGGKSARYKRLRRLVLAAYMPLLRIFSRGSLRAGPAGPLFGKNRPPACSSGPHSPGRQIRKVQTAPPFGPRSVHAASADFSRGVPPLHSPPQGQNDAKPCRLRSAAPIRRINRRTDMGFVPLCPHHISFTS